MEISPLFLSSVPPSLGLVGVWLGWQQSCQHTLLSLYLHSLSVDWLEPWAVLPSEPLPGVGHMVGQ